MISYDFLWRFLMISYDFNGQKHNHIDVQLRSARQTESPCDRQYIAMCNVIRFCFTPHVGMSVIRFFIFARQSRQRITKPLHVRFELFEFERNTYT